MVQAKDLTVGGKYYDIVKKITERFGNLTSQIEYTLANCTVAVCVCALINNLPMPVSKITNANKFHTVVANGWKAIPYEEGMALKENDILEWSCNHVAYVVSNVNDVVASWWTNYNGTSKGDRSDTKKTKTVDETIEYFYKNYQYRFFHKTTFIDECNKAGGKVKPSYVLRYEQDDKDYKTLYNETLKKLEKAKKLAQEIINL